MRQYHCVAINLSVMIFWSILFVAFFSPLSLVRNASLFTKRSICCRSPFSFPPLVQIFLGTESYASAINPGKVLSDGVSVTHVATGSKSESTWTARRERAGENTPADLLFCISSEAILQLFRCLFCTCEPGRRAERDAVDCQCNDKDQNEAGESLHFSGACSPFSHFPSLEISSRSYILENCSTVVNKSEIL